MPALWPFFITWEVVGKGGYLIDTNGEFAGVDFLESQSCLERHAFPPFFSFFLSFFNCDPKKRTAGKERKGKEKKGNEILVFNDNCTSCPDRLF